MASIRTALFLSLIAACSSASPGADAGSVDAGTADAGGDAGPPPTASGDPGQRAACAYQPGALAGDTLDPGAPVGRSIPIDHIVLMMQENRAFDAYYSQLSIPGQTVDGAAPDATNPDPTDAGPAISRFHQTSFCFDDTSHGWDAAHEELSGGTLQGFTAANATSRDPTGHRAMGYYDDTDIPYYYALAQTFAISDRHFCSVLGPTWPNRMFYFAGTSFGLTNNNIPPEKDPSGKPYPNILLRLNDAKVSWKFYSQDIPTALIFPGTWSANYANFEPIENFLSDAAAGTLPAVSIVEGTDRKGGANADEHPPGDMQVGEAFVASIVNALIASPNWSSSALFLTYDENGGQFDHVVPPTACAPDDLPINTTNDPGGVGFTQYGFRTPLLVVSPYAKRGYVSHTVVDHTSITRFVEARFNLPAMTVRDANAAVPFDMFDFSAPNLTAPNLPDAPLDSTQAATCAMTYPPAKGEL